MAQARAKKTVADQQRVRVEVLACCYIGGRLYEPGQQMEICLTGNTPAHLRVLDEQPVL